MKGNLKYKVILVVTILIFILVELLKPRPVDWTVTLHPEDKIPFGTYAFREFLPDLFTEGNLTVSRESVYQALKRDSTQNLIITGKILDLGEEDIESLRNSIENGGKALLIVEDLNASMSDSIDINFNYNLFIGEQILATQDSISLNFDEKNYKFPDAFVNSSISPFSSGYEILSRTDNGKIIFIEKTIGEGKLYICTLPLLTTNYSLLSGDNVEIMESMVGKLPDEKTTWTTLYSSVTTDSTSILRYLLSEPSLRWAYVITILSLFIFMIFRIKREQRAIPTIKPPRNSSADFAVTVGQLYMKQGNHKDIALKRLIYLKDFLASRYFINVNYAEEEIEKVVHKTGKDPMKVKELYSMISYIQRTERVSRDSLIEFNKKLEDFYNN
ncbi:MAG: DUF4350 domain-containing protein [Cyclobacteriaceae bacterium]